MKTLSLEERLYLDETRPDRVSHLTVETPAACLSCEAKPCTRVCPAGTYSWSDEQQKILVSFENCLECGACRAACPPRAIAWRSPMGGLGICYRYG